MPNSNSNFPASLLRGYRAFTKGRFIEERKRYQRLAEKGQAPETMMIACCDSRASPATIFNALPGQIFVVRNVANLVPPYMPDGDYHSTSAALEFAVQNLKVMHIVVLGHGRCGGIEAALNQSGNPFSPSDFIGKWMELLAPATDMVAADQELSAVERQLALERISIRCSIANLRTFPFVGMRERNAQLSLHGAWFDISKGELWIMDPETGDFFRPPAEPNDFDNPVFRGAKP